MKLLDFHYLSVLQSWLITAQGKSSVGNMFQSSDIETTHEHNWKFGSFGSLSKHEVFEFNLW